MPDLKHIISMRCPVTFDWHGERIELAYRPYSEAIENTIKGDDEAWSLVSMKALIERVVLDWNITSDGKPAPVDAATLTALPSELIMGIFYACQNDLRDPKLPSVTAIAST
jgi:hypothetical protein